MQRSRFTYALLVVATMIIGLLSRRFAFVPLFVGDILWASLVYFLFRFVFIHAAVKAVVIYSLIFSFAIEFGQLYSAPWIMDLRKTLFGKLVLGATFNWGDLLCYVAGIGVAAGVEVFGVRRGK